MRGAINLADIGGDERRVRRLGSVKKWTPVDAQKNSDAFFVFLSESYASPKPMRRYVHNYVFNAVSLFYHIKKSPG